ncbi:MAG: hypothetical protein ACRKGH_09665 [Dehalogenimonas sp.]
MAKTNAIVIDRQKGWGAETLPETDLNVNWKKRLVGNRWLPVVIRQTDESGKVTYTQPEIPKDVKAPPEKLWRALTAIFQICQRLFPGDSQLWKKAKLVSLVVFLIVLGFVLVVVGTEMIGPA